MIYLGWPRTVVLRAAVLSSLLRMSELWEIWTTVAFLPVLFISSRKKTQYFAASLFCKSAAHDGGCGFFDGQGRWVAARWPTYGRPRIEANSATGLSPLRDLFIIGATLIPFSPLASPPPRSTRKTRDFCRIYEIVFPHHSNVGFDGNERELYSAIRIYVALV